mmetsp:Transcript_18640/g.41474  ORF Transcript_18640/g.41474 Transcript_18640/m.41474 type:complete len:228 (+) Transcript_18640:1506-2189(+)
MPSFSSSTISSIILASWSAVGSSPSLPPADPFTTSFPFTLGGGAAFLPFLGFVKARAASASAAAVLTFLQAWKAASFLAIEASFAFALASLNVLFMLLICTWRSSALRSRIVLMRCVSSQASHRIFKMASLCFAFSWCSSTLSSMLAASYTNLRGCETSPVIWKIASLSNPGPLFFEALVSLGVAMAAMQDADSSLCSVWGAAISIAVGLSSPSLSRTAGVFVRLRL